MANIVKLSDYKRNTLKSYGQRFNIGPISFGIKKIRLHMNFLPDVTIDMTSKGTSMTKLLHPRASILMSSGNAFLIDPLSKNKIQSISPSIFRKPTMLDSIMSVGVIPTLLLIVGIGYGTYKLVSKQ